MEAVECSPPPLRCFTIPIAETSVLLRGFSPTSFIPPSILWRTFLDLIAFRL